MNCAWKEMTEICSNMQRLGARGRGGANASCQGNDGLFWALDFVDDENHSPPMVGLSPPPLLEVVDAELNI